MTSSSFERKKMGNKEKVIYNNDSNTSYVNEGKNSCCFSNRIFCFFAMISILVLGVMIGKYIGEKRNIKPNFTNGDVMEFAGKTWIAYGDPIVNFTVISDKNCAECDTVKIESEIKSLIPTAVGKNIDISDTQAAGLLSDVNAKSLPVFIFDIKLDKISNFSQIDPAFEKVGNYYVLNLMKIGQKPGKLLEVPPISSNDPQKGPADAPVTIIEYSDFQCPFCKRGFDTMQQVLSAYSGKIRFVFKQFPLSPSIHPNARIAANASLCANEQGKFWEMYDILFTNQDKLASGDLKEYAKRLKLDAQKFNSCLDSSKYDNVIDANIKEGTIFGVSGTPAFFVNNVFVNGAQPFEEFKKIIDGELAPVKK